MWNRHSIPQKYFTAPYRYHRDFWFSLPLFCKFAEIPVTTAARICVSLIVSFSYPLQCNPARRSVLTLIRSTFGGGREPSIAVYRMRYTFITVRIDWRSVTDIDIVSLFLPSLINICDDAIDLSAIISSSILEHFIWLMDSSHRFSSSQPLW